jgi:hypothetical protein
MRRTIHTVWKAPRFVGARGRTPCQGPACRGKQRCRMHGGITLRPQRQPARPEAWPPHGARHERCEARRLYRRCGNCWFNSGRRSIW